MMTEKLSACIATDKVEASRDSNRFSRNEETVMNNTVCIRSAVSQDVDLLADFNSRMALETEERKLDPETVRRGVAAMFEDTRRGFYLIAQRSGQPVGSLMITREWSDWRNAVFWWIQSVYVLPEFRKQGVLRTLFDEVRRLADDSGNVCGLRLYVERENITAQSAYNRLGISEAQYKMFEEMLDD